MRVTNKNRPAAIRNREPFTTGTSRGFTDGRGHYVILSYSTTVARFDEAGRIAYFDAAWYSATTNRLQGEILAAAEPIDRERILRLTDAGKYPARERAGVYRSEALVY